MNSEYGFPQGIGNGGVRETNLARTREAHLRFHHPGGSHEFLLYKRDLLAHACGVGGGFIPARSRADHDQIVHKASTFSIFSLRTFKNLAPGAPSTIW